MNRPALFSSAKSFAKRQPRDVRGGIRYGCFFATCFSAVAAGSIFLHFGGDVTFAEAVGVWTRVTVFYYVAGVLGGALWGFLRPIQHTYSGRYLTAYLMLFLVYGGGTAAFWPMMQKDAGRNGASLAVMLIVWAVLSLVLAPIYVWMSRG